MSGYTNPLLKLPAAQQILALPPSPEKQLIVELLTQLRDECDVLAEKSWRRRKGPIACYWRAAATYVLHTARVLKRSGRPAALAQPVAPAQACGAANPAALTAHTTSTEPQPA